MRGRINDALVIDGDFSSFSKLDADTGCWSWYQNYLNFSLPFFLTFAFHFIIGLQYYHFWVVQLFMTTGMEIHAKSTSAVIFIHVFILQVLVFSSNCKCLWITLKSLRAETIPDNKLILGCSLQNNSSNNITWQLPFRCLTWLRKSNQHQFPFSEICQNIFRQSFQ